MHDTKEYAQISEKNREDGKQNTRVLNHLGPDKNQADRDRYMGIFRDELQKLRIKGTELEKLSFDPLLDFGILYAARMLMQETRIMKSLSVLRKYQETVFLMVAARLINPGSNFSITRLIRTVYYPREKPRIDKDELYRALDALLAFKDRMEMDMFNKLKPDISVVHYYLTSTYLEGREGNDIVLFGYSTNKKQGKEQIVIGDSHGRWNPYTP